MLRSIKKLLTNSLVTSEIKKGYEKACKKKSCSDILPVEPRPVLLLAGVQGGVLTGNSQDD